VLLLLNCINIFSVAGPSICSFVDLCWCVGVVVLCAFVVPAVFFGIMLCFLL
jgi:hypothetical protein